MPEINDWVAAPAANDWITPPAAPAPSARAPADDWVAAPASTPPVTTLPRVPMEGGEGGFAPAVQLDAQGNPLNQGAPRGAFERVTEAAAHAAGDRPIGHIEGYGQVPGPLGVGARAVDAGLRGLSAAVAGGSGLIPALAEKAGMDPATANKLHRDLKMLVDTAMNIGGTTGRIPRPVEQVGAAPKPIARAAAERPVEPAPVAPPIAPEPPPGVAPFNETSVKAYEARNAGDVPAERAIISNAFRDAGVNWTDAEATLPKNVSAPEKITEAATLYNGKLYTGPIHADATNKILDAQNLTGEARDAFIRREHNSMVQGFVTSHGRFIGRAEAAKRTAGYDEATFAVGEPLSRASEPPPETIKTAAYRVGDRVFESPIHATAMDDAMTALGAKHERDIVAQHPGATTADKYEAHRKAQGFVTSTGRFVEREEAQQIAKQLEQLKEGKKGNRLGGLNAEDLRGVELPPDPAMEQLKQLQQRLSPDPNRIGNNLEKEGFYFFKTPDNANTFAQGENANIRPAKIRMENPLVHDMRGQTFQEGSLEQMQVVQRAKAEGRDGVVFQNYRDGNIATPDTVYTPFKTENVRSLYTAPGIGHNNPPGPPPQSLGAAAPGARPSGMAPLPPTPAAAQQAVLSRIGTPPKAGLPTVTDAYTQLVDNLHPIRKLVEESAQGKPVDTILNPYEQFRLARGVGGKADHFLHHGTFDFGTLKDVGPSFTKLMKPVEKDLPGFKAYIMAKRALELEPRGVESGIPLAEARVTVADGAKRFEQTAQALQRYQSEMLDYVHKSGLLSDEAVAAMRAASDDYLPFYRIMDDPRISGGTGRGFSTRTPTSTLKGSERLIVDPLESVIKNTQTFIALAERNRALNTFVDFAKNNGNVKLQRVQQARPITVHANELDRVLDDMGVPPGKYGPSENFDIFRKMDKQLAGDEIAVWHDGKRTVYRTDPDIAAIVKGMDEESLQLWQRIAAAPARWLRAGVVLSPEYMVRNFTRDQMNATVQSKYGYRPVYDMLKGLWQIGAGGKAYREWLKGGGSQSALVAIDRDYAGKDIWKYGPNPGAIRQVKNVANTPIEILRAISESLDNSTRVGEFMRATKGKDDPASIMRGAMAARDVTQDFQRRGAATRAYNSITAFANAQIQGVDRELSTMKGAFKDPKRAAAVFTKIAGMITLPSVLLWAANHGDPRYENAPNWEKDQFWFILPRDPKQEAYRVPKPFTLGMTFGSLPERILSDYFDGKPDAYNDFLKSLSGSLVPNMVPTFAVPMIEQFGNRSIFLDRPIVPDRLKRGLVTEQYTAQTPEIARLAGKGVSKIPGMSESNLASPMMLENYVRQWGGTMGRYGMAAADKAIGAAGLSDKPPAPASTIADMPVIRAFISRYPSASAQPIQDFYRMHGELEKLATSARNLQREGQSDRGELMRAQIYERTKGPARQLGVLNREIRTIQADRTMNPEDKRQKIRDAYLEMISIAEQGNRTIRNAKANLAKRGYQGPD